MKAGKAKGRAELTPAQRAAAVQRRSQIWEALHPEGGKTVPTLGGTQHIAFAADTAKAAGMTKRSINQMPMRGRWR